MTFKQRIEQVIREELKLEGEDVAFTLDFKVGYKLNGAIPASLEQPKQKREYKKKKQIMLGDKPLALGKGPSKSLHRDYTTSNDDIFCIRHFFSKWKRDGILNVEQLEAVNRTEGLRLSLLSDQAKEEMLKVFLQVREEKLFSKKGEPANV